MHKILHTIAEHMSAIALILILLVTSIDYHCFNRSFYADQYQTLNTAQKLEMSEEDLMLATEVLLDYLRLEQDNCDVTITQEGIVQEAFNTREKTHMVDVRSLYDFALNIRNVSIIVLAVSLIYLIVYEKKIPWFSLASAFLKMAVLFLLFVSFLGIWAYVDFDAFWTQFHKVFFTNDLWLLNPATDLMINLFPSPVFSALVFRILATFLIPFIALIGTSVIYIRKKVRGGSIHETVDSSQRIA